MLKRDEQLKFSAGQSSEMTFDVDVFKFHYPCWVDISADNTFINLFVN